MEKLSLQARPSLQTKAGLHIFCCKFVHNTHTMSSKLYDFISMMLNFSSGLFLRCSERILRFTLPTRLDETRKVIHQFTFLCYFLDIHTTQGVRERNGYATLQMTENIFWESTITII